MGKRFESAQDALREQMRNMLSNTRGATKERMLNSAPTLATHHGLASEQYLALHEGCEHAVLWKSFVVIYHILSAGIPALHGKYEHPWRSAADLKAISKSTK